jgi:polysaccharide biosynthesis/export protein
MSHKLLMMFLLSGSFCAGQSAPTAPATDQACVPTEAAPCPQYGSVATPSITTPTLNAPALANGAGANPAESVSARPEAAVQSTRLVGPITTRSEFELFAEDAAGRRLKVYGRQLFDEVPNTFAPMDRVPVPSDYTIGPGDELLIRVWGKIDLDTKVTVDRNGQIFIPKVGTLSVAGLRFEQLESYLQTAISNIYKGFELNVSLGQLRSIQIFVLGSARQPGAYTISSLSTLVNALFASGGPSATGSMRNIQLRRADRIVTEFDIYDLLRRGDKSHDVQLLPGDVIYIPPVGPQVALLGSVNEPGIYELKGQTTIAAALKDAGGLTNMAEADRALLERIENHRRRTVDDFPLDASSMQRALQDGDMLRIFPISPKFDNAVMLRGNVAQRGRFPWHEGMRVSDLIPSRDFLITRSYWYQQNHLAESAPSGNSMGEQNDDQIERNSERSQQNAVPGARQYEGEPNAQAGSPESSQSESPDRTQQQSTEHTHLQSPEHKRIDMMADLDENSTEINWDYAAIQRLNEQDLSTDLIPFNLGNAISNPASPDNQLLKPGDVITIFSRKDLPLPTDKHAMFARIDGEVNAPGVYRINPGDTLRELVERAGGLTPHSYLYASQLTRVSTREAEEEQLRISASQMQRELTSRFATANTANSSNPAEDQAQFSAQQSALNQLAAVHPTGRIILDMKPSAKAIADIPSFALEDGDSFHIPPRMSTVQVAGAVYNENAFRYQPGKRLSAYLNDAGGPSRQADTRRIFLIRADGTVISRQTHGEFWRSDFESTTLLPGDAIIVPTKLKTPGGFMQQLPFITQMLAQTAMAGAIVSEAH